MGEANNVYKNMGSFACNFKKLNIPILNMILEKSKKVKKECYGFIREI